MAMPKVPRPMSTATDASALQLTARVAQPALGGQLGGEVQGQEDALPRPAVLGEIVDDTLQQGMLGVQRHRGNRQNRARPAGCRV